jgi:hypothetical protein
MLLSRFQIHFPSREYSSTVRLETIKRQNIMLIIVELQSLAYLLADLLNDTTCSKARSEHFERSLQARVTKGFQCILYD